ncbi:MAG: hypothetical protein A2350_13915 [Candidatus Raymondbacteria bacterium RifOxyB12_full_50_8]|nr:MAG: hypothetical protein A2350_13915 [Candidatus Raymondbacteria bacterium RifOxyB12_full_50_8]
MNNATIVERLSEIERLPTLPVVIRELQALIVNPRSNMSQIAKAISRDQAIASRVIRLVNSAFYGLRTPVASIQQAIVILGLNTVKNITLGVSVVNSFGSSVAASIFDREQFWIHGFATALASKYLARGLKYPEPEDFFLTGLLHDIGILVLDQFFHDEFVQVLQCTVRQKALFHHIEKECLATDHCEIGSLLAEKWGLPKFVIDAIRYHHTPGMGMAQCPESRDKIALAHVAEAEMRQRGIGSVVPGWINGPETHIREKTAIAVSDIDAISNKVGEEVQALMKEWGI